MTIAIAPARQIELMTMGQQDCPVLAFDNVARTASLGGNAVLPDGAAANAFTGATYAAWRPDVTGFTAVLSVTFPAPVAVQCAALAAHNLGSLGATASVEVSPDGVTWEDGGAGVIAPVTDGPVMWRMARDGLAATRWRWVFGNLSSGDLLRVGVAFMGPEMVVPDRIYQGVSPILSPTEVQLQSNISQGGHLMGTSVIFQGSTFQTEFAHVGQNWVRSQLPPFLDHFNRGKGFFMGWRPTLHPGDLHYCWRDGAVARPVNSGPRDLMSFGLSMRVYEG